MIFRRSFNHDMFAAAEMGIMVVVPGRNRIDDLVAFINDATEKRIDQGPAAAGDQNLTRLVVEAFPIPRKRGDRFAQVRIAFGGGVIREMLAIGFNYLVFELLRNRENLRIKIADRKIEDLLAVSDLLANLSSQSYDFGAY